MGMTEQKLYIGGKYQDATSGETFDTINPATGEVITSVQHAGPPDVDARSPLPGRDSRYGARCPVRSGAGSSRGRRLLREKQRGDLASLEVPTPASRWQEAVAVDVMSGADCHRVLRRHGSVDSWRDLRPRQRLGLHPARAARGLRRNRSLELPGPDRLLEVGPRPGLRQRDGLQARRAHPTHRGRDSPRSTPRPGSPMGFSTWSRVTTAPARHWSRTLGRQGLANRRGRHRQAG